MAPKKPSVYQTATIAARTQLTKRVQRITLLPELPIDWIPGQFIVTKSQVSGADKIADYTILPSEHSDGDDSFDILVDNYPGSEIGKLLHEADIGTAVTFKGPRGGFTLRDELLQGSVSSRIVFAWRDIGCAAGVPLLLQLSKLAEGAGQSSPIVVLDFLTDDFEPVYPHFQSHLEALSVDYRKYTSAGVEADLLDTGNFPKKRMVELFADIADSDIYISGASQFVKKLRQKFIQIGTDKGHIEREFFG